MEKSREVYLKKVDCGGSLGTVVKVLDELNLNTVCRSARCPNRTECFKRGTATFLIMGPVCTRSCTYCSVEKGIPSPLDKREPLKVALAVKKLGIRHAVITSTTRDDLEDGGLSHFIETVSCIKSTCYETEVEVLVPDFGGRWDRLGELLGSGITVFNHNIEAVKRLFKKVRPKADYETSLNLLKEASSFGGVVVKSGIMVGFGETMDDIRTTFEDLRCSGVSVVTVGQYLRPTRRHPKPLKVYTEEDFSKVKEIADEFGFEAAVVGPFVRSSYRAEEVRKAVGGNAV